MLISCFDAVLWWSVWLATNDGPMCITAANRDAECGCSSGMIISRIHYYRRKENDDGGDEIDVSTVDASCKTVDAVIPATGSFSPPGYVSLFALVKRFVAIIVQTTTTKMTTTAVVVVRRMG